MLKITVDIFSGRPNPSWIVADEGEARDLLRELGREQGLLAEEAPVEAGLGLRGFEVEPLDDELGSDYDLNGSIYLPARGGRGGSRAQELAERLLATEGRGTPAASVAGAEAQPLDPTVRDLIASQLRESAGGRTSSEDSRETAPPPPAEDEASTAATCQIEVGAFNPGFWNNDANVRANNNCYNYASNKRTNTFAQPGLGCGHMYTALTCPAVTQAALCDGLHRRFTCFPDSEKPRYLVALVVAPGADYHWYRKQKEGFWGHKPGRTAARNVDNSNRVITNPETCDRGIYTQFCGYFYTCRSQRIR